VSRAAVRRWGVRVALLLGAGAVALFAYSFALTYDSRYSALPASVWEAGDPQRIREAAGVADIYQPTSVDEMLGAAVADGAPPPGLRMAADRFVDLLNRMGEGSVLYHEADSFGNLYLVMGAQILDTSIDHKEHLLNHLANAWQQYLSDSFGGWDGAGGFRPGIVLVDTQGKYAQVLNGEIAIFRAPVY
jgi:hypothetical protein